MAPNSATRSDPARPLKDEARKLEHQDDLTEEDKQNLVKAGLGALAVAVVGIIAFIAAKHDSSSTEKRVEQVRQTADSFPGRLQHTASKLADDLKVASKEGAKDLKRGANAAKDEAKSWFK